MAQVLNQLGFRMDAPLGALESLFGLDDSVDSVSDVFADALEVANANVSAVPSCEDDSVSDVFADALEAIDPSSVADARPMGAHA